MDIKHSTWLTTNELQEAAKALKMVDDCLQRAEEDHYHWKWVLVALHNSLQGYMVCALRGQNELNVLKDRVAQLMLEAEKDNLPKPREELDTFLNLFKKIQNEKMMAPGEGKKYVPKGHQDRSIRKINQLRNQFIHFKPKAWVLELNILPKIALDGIDVIDFLVFTSGTIKAAGVQKKDIRADLDKIEQNLLRLEKCYS